MKFFAYVCTPSVRVDPIGRDSERGILGTVRDLPEPLAECDTLDAAITAGLAYLGRHPSASVYVVDSNSLLREILLCHAHHEQVSSLERRLFVAWTCCALAAMSFLGTGILGLGMAGLAVAMLTIGLYLTMVRVGFMNEVESAVACAVFLILQLLLLPALRMMWAAYQLTIG